MIFTNANFRKARTVMVFKVILIILLFSMACMFLAAEASAKSPSTDGTDHEDSNPMPHYSLLFNEAAILRESGKPVQALKKLEDIYACDVPVQSFFETLDRVKLDVIEALGNNFQIRLGHDTFSINGLKNFFIEVLLPRPDLLQYRFINSKELPFCRYLLLNLLYGKGHEKPLEDALLTHASPDLDVTEAIESLDPWIVSAALFMARKQPGSLSPQRLVKRWERRPDLWDEICTDQALLFLAGFSFKTLSRIRSSNDDVQHALTNLTSAPLKGKSQVQVLFFWRDDIQRADTSSYLNVLPCQKMTLRNHPQQHCRKGILSLSPGSHTLKIHMEDADCKSPVFTCQPGQMIRIVMPVSGQI